MSEATRHLLNRERLLIADLRNLLSRVDAKAHDLEELRIALRDLEGLFMIVVCGEYNAGKSTFLNALLGMQVMLEGVTPTTDRITIVTYGDTPKDIAESDYVLRREYPVEVLHDVALVDTPGTNAIIKQHQELTEGFVPRADLVIFVTSADRPFTESERTFLELISSWGKKIVVVVNKLDIHEEEEERQKVLAFVRQHAYDTLRVEPPVFGVYARKAFRAKKAGDIAALADTGLPEVERYIAESLAGGERVRLKMKNPLGVAQRIADSYGTVVKQRLALLDDDRRTLEEVDRQITQFEKDMHREFEGYLARVKTAFLEVERRGDIFFDDMVQFRRMITLMDAERVRKDFNARVIRGSDQDIDRAVSETVDWFIHRNLQLWEDVMTFVQQRRKAGEERVIGEVGGRFQYDREALIRTLNQRAEDVLRTYDHDTEARRMVEGLQSAVLRTGMMQVGGIGIGAATVALFSGLAFDVTGIMAGLAVAGMGLFVLPQRRKMAKRQLHERMQELRDNISQSLQQQFEDELRRSSDKLSNAISSYTRFVRSELKRLSDLKEEMGEVQSSMRNLRLEIEDLP